MSIYREIDRSPTPRKLLEFGAVFLVGMVILGLLQRFAFHRAELARGLWIAGAAVFALSFVRPIGRLLYIGWMGLGVTLGLVTSPIILLLVYGLLIVPVGLVFRIRSRDAMKRRLDPAATSYWEDYPQTKDPAQYLKQF